MNQLKTSILKYTFFISAIYTAIMLFHHLNFIQMDFTGHLWSSVQLGRGLFQSYSDQIFMGYTHGLFYPPLEDFILLVLRTFSGGTSFESFRFYLIVVYCAFVWSVWFALERIKNVNIRLVLGFCFLFLFNISKISGLHLQGLGATDIIFNGLSSEFLSAIFFFVMLAKIAESEFKHWLLISILLSLIILSHIVIGLIAIILLIAMFANRNDYRIGIKILGLSCLLTAFYWLPFVLNLKYLAGSSVVKDSHWYEFGFAVLLTVLFRKNKYARSLSGIAAGIFLVNSVLIDVTAILLNFPHFHYYRLVILADFFLIYSIGFAANNFELSNQRFVKIALYGFAVLSLGFLFKTEKLLDLEKYWPSLQRTSMDFSNIGDLAFPSYGRYLVFGTDRTVDFGIDSILAAKNPDFKSTKGIFWESSKSNSLQSSMLATLFAPPVVLDYAYYKGFDCAQQTKLLDQYFRYFNVKGIIMNPGHMNQVEFDKSLCYRGMLMYGTEYSRFKSTGTFIVNNEAFFVYQLESKPEVSKNSTYTTDAIELMDLSQLIPLDSTTTPQSQSIHAIFDETAELDKTKLKTWITDKIFLAIQKDLGEKKQIDELKIIPDFKKLNQTQYQISIPSNQPKLFAVKLSPQPGIKLTDASGKNLPLYESYPYILGIGQGEITLSFERQKYFYICWMISIVTLIGLLAYLYNDKSSVDATRNKALQLIDLLKLKKRGI